MVEIGKRDFIGRGKLAMDMFQENRSFFGVDLAPMYVKRPEMAKRYNTSRSRLEARIASPLTFITVCWNGPWRFTKQERFNLSSR